MVLEKLSGCTAESRIAEPGFADVRYVRAMLQQVLRAVDRAYGELGAFLLSTAAALGLLICWLSPSAQTEHLFLPRTQHIACCLDSDACNTRCLRVCIP